MRLILLAGAAAALVCVAACGAPKTTTRATETISVDGSSTVFPLSEAAAESFSHNARGGARVTVGESGTGGGFRKFCRGETQIQGASRPILATGRAGKPRFVEIPIAFDG